MQMDPNIFIQQMSIILIVAEGDSAIICELCGGQSDENHDDAKNCKLL